MRELSPVVRNDKDKAKLVSDLGYDPFVTPKNSIDRFFTSLLDIMDGEYDRGFNDGYNRAIEECNQGLLTSDNEDEAYNEGFDDGVESALDFVEKNFIIIPKEESPIINREEPKRIPPMFNHRLF